MHRDGIQYVDKFYTYQYLRENGTPYYVGKGVGERAFRKHERQNVSVPKNTARILVQVWGSEQEALEMEKWYVQFFGRKDLKTGILRNRTVGGDQPPSRKGVRVTFSPEHCRKLKELGRRKRESGWTHSSEARAKIGAARKGTSWTEDAERVQKAKLRVVKANHLRWHLKRGMVSSNCNFCGGAK